MSSRKWLDISKSVLYLESFSVLDDLDIIAIFVFWEWMWIRIKGFKKAICFQEKRGLFFHFKFNSA